MALIDAFSEELIKVKPPKITDDILLNNFNELKNIIEKNFSVLVYVKYTFYKSDFTKKPLTLEILNIFSHKDSNYLEFKFKFPNEIRESSLKEKRYIMSVGKIGELKDKIFFIPYEVDIENNNNILKIIDNAFGMFISGYSFDYIQTEQLFMFNIIKYYKDLII